jgi:uncharacterized protein
MVRIAGYVHRLVGKHAPTREDLAKSRWLKPFGERVWHSQLWRFTRRSVPRGVFAGLFIGIFLMVPGLQIAGAVLVSMPLRGNIPLAAAMTFLSNPATTPFFLLAAIELGNWLGFRADLAAFEALRTSHASVSEWVAWLLSSAAPAMVTGLFLISVGCALVGYILSIVVWRWWVHHKWRSRADRV